MTLADDRTMSTLIRERRGPIDRALVLLAALGVVYVARQVVTPRWRVCIDPWVHSLPRDARTVAGHVLVWTFPMAIFSGITLAFLIRSRRFEPLSLTRDLRRAVTDALWATLIGVVAVVAVAKGMGLPFGFRIRGWVLAANVVSNGYEELVERGLIFTAAWYALGSRLAAALFSGLVFALGHEQYPLPLRAVVAFGGFIWSWIYARTGNFLAPWLSHQLADMVLDVILLT
ncbi:CPBP family intramembrane metalloprotease [Pendulispora rubella]|uniref:CPBP family intramembrane metalloprotease n=1 Tax=Pendulispora rubella TaxID=2741070 RepID=A0ABZ2KZF3_9BACT